MDANNQEYGMSSQGQDTSAMHMGVATVSKRINSSSGSASQSTRASLAASGLSFEGMLNSLKTAQHATIGETAKGDPMSSITREELDAKLGQNKAEVDSLASAMRADMAQWREQNNTQMSAIQAQLSSLNSKIDGKFEGMEGKVDGVKSSLSTMQWMVGTILAMIGIVAAILAIPGIDKVI